MISPKTPTGLPLSGAWVAVRDTVTAFTMVALKALVAACIVVTGWVGLSGLVAAWLRWPTHVTVFAAGALVGWWTAWRRFEGRVLEVELARKHKDTAVDTAMGLAFEAQRVDEENAVLLAFVASGETPAVGDDLDVPDWVNQGGQP